jgi:hypothetical protein
MPYFDLPIYYIDEDAATTVTLNSSSFDNTARALFPDLFQDTSGRANGAFFPEFYSIGAGGGGYNNNANISAAQQLQSSHETAHIPIPSSLIDNTINLNTPPTRSLIRTSSSFNYATSAEIYIPQHQQQQQEMIIMQQYLSQQEDFFLNNNYANIDISSASPLSLQGSFVNTPSTSSSSFSSAHDTASATTTTTSLTNFSSPVNTAITTSSSRSSSNSSTNSRQQQLRHRQQQQVICPICNRKFVRPQEMNRHHSSVHAGKRDFHCNVCPASFARKDALNRHIKTLALRGDHRHGTYQSNGDRKEK